MVNIGVAKVRFSKLIDRVLAGEEIVIARGGLPVARLAPYAMPTKVRRLGRFKGRVRMSRDFDAPLPDEVLGEFE